MSIFEEYGAFPVNTQRRNNVVLTSLRRYFNVACLLGLTQRSILHLNKLV